jgi:pyrroloquinoline quinone biosynthesis protein B
VRFLSLILGLAAAAGAAVPAGPAVTARVLGVSQDGGVPHLGCTKACCAAARRDPARAVRVASLALAAGGRTFLIDATPDLRTQLDTALGPGGLEARPPGLPLDGILLTHAHIGHYAGLMFLGRESMAANGVPVYATRRMGAFLAANGPWKRLVDGRHIRLHPIEPGRPVELAPGLTVEPFAVPHREEESDVVGFLVRGPSRRLVYLPDIDDWSKWDHDIASLVGSVDVALLDGTFWSPQELGARSMTDVPHPLIPSTMDRLEPLVKRGHRVMFIHLNHTNPVLRPDSAERLEVERRGFEVAADGLSLAL